MNKVAYLIKYKCLINVQQLSKHTFSYIPSIIIQMCVHEWKKKKRYQCNVKDMNDKITHIPSLTVSCTEVYVSKPILSTPHQYPPMSDSWSCLKVTEKAPAPESTRVILPDSAVAPDCTVTSLSLIPLHAALQRYLVIFEANLWEHWNETSPPTNPSTLISAPSIPEAAKIKSCNKS